MKKYYLPTGLTLLLLIALAYSCSKSDDFLEIDNLFSSIDSKNQALTKKGSPNVFKNHLQNLEAEIVYDGVVLQDVFCYAPIFGGNAIFLFPSRGLDLNNLQANQVVTIPGGGGGTPEQFNNAISSNNRLIIKNQISNPCLKNVVEKILHKDNLKLMGILGTYIERWKNGPEGYTNITFTDSDVSKRFPIDETNRVRMANWNPPYDNSNIDLDTIYLPYYSEEKITATILHEFLHRFYYGINKETATQDHERMISSYLDLFKPAMQGLYPNLTDSEAFAILVFGLNDTDYYKKNILNNEELQNEIRNINRDYSNVGSKGSRCH